MLNSLVGPIHMHTFINISCCTPETYTILLLANLKRNILKWDWEEWLCYCISGDPLSSLDKLGPSGTEGASEESGCNRPKVLHWFACQALAIGLTIMMVFTINLKGRETETGSIHWFTPQISTTAEPRVEGGGWAPGTRRAPP